MNCELQICFSSVGKPFRSKEESMRFDRRLFPRLNEGFELSVKGLDMFGAPFVENTRVLNLSQEGLCFLLLRPVSVGGTLDFVCQSSDSSSKLWIRGCVVWVSERFDGYQLVGLNAKGQNRNFQAERAASIA